MTWRWPWVPTKAVNELDFQVFDRALQLPDFWERLAYYCVEIRDPDELQAYVENMRRAGFRLLIVSIKDRAGPMEDWGT